MSRRLAVTGGLLIALALAVLCLQSIILELLVVPAVYLWVSVRLFLQGVPSSTYWAMFLAAAALAFILSIFRRVKFPDIRRTETAPIRGQVEEIAGNIYAARKSIFSKWLLANRIVELARAIMKQRRSREYTDRTNDLDGEDWDPPENLRAYFEAGANRFFLEIRRRRYFWRSQKTPFEVDLNEVIEFLETKMRT